MRLIDADALLTSVYRKYGPIDALEGIRNAQTVEAEPVRRATWIKHGRMEGKEVLACSACKQGITSMFAPEYHYCPTCGAKMDEEENA